MPRNKASGFSMGNPYCVGCQFRDRSGIHVCDYFTVMSELYPGKKDHRRGCSIGECQHWKDPVIRLRPSGVLWNANVKRIAERAERVRIMVELYKQGLADEEIAAVLHISTYTVRDWRNKAGLSIHSRGGGEG